MQHRAASTHGTLYYQSERVPRSLRSTGRVGTCRDLLGSDGEFFGVDPIPKKTEIANGRGRGFSLDENGFCLIDHALEEHIDYYNNEAILNSYYAECESLVAQQTGASYVLAFDHNLRSKQRKAAADLLTGSGASAIQEPLISYGVHNDYTVTSAPRRIEQLAGPLGQNDTLRARAGGPRLPRTNELERLLRGRWQFINVWRNVSPHPVESHPLGLCDAQTVSKEDLVTFEIRYAERVGENYFASHSDAHRWYYFPSMSRDEAVLLKCWDSRGRDFLGFFEQERNLPRPSPDAGGSAGGAGAVPESVAATFSLHSGFVDEATAEGARDRESIEVRVVAFFDS